MKEGSGSICRWSIGWHCKVRIGSHPIETIIGKRTIFGEKTEAFVWNGRSTERVVGCVAYAAGGEFNSRGRWCHIVFATST